jgi:hypothetical protein
MLPDILSLWSNQLAKFALGQKVRLTSRAPNYIIKGLRQRTRTIVAISPMSQGDGAHYYLGGRGKSYLADWHYPFRSYMLEPAPTTAPIGRPRLKRKYNRKEV